MAHHRRYRRKRTPDRHRYFVRFESGGVNPPGTIFHTPRQTVTMEVPPPDAPQPPTFSFSIEFYHTANPFSAGES